MAQASFKKIQDTVTKNLEDMIKNLDDNRGFIKLAVIPMYSNAQRKKFQTENASEGEQWLPITKETLAYKLKYFGSSPGGGTKTLIRTGALYQSIFPGGDKNKTVTERRSFITATEVKYAEYVNQIRPIFKFKSLTKDIKAKYIEYLKTGRINGS